MNKRDKGLIFKILGYIACEGSAHEVMTKENLKELFNIDAEIVEDPRSKKPVCITYDMVG